MPDVDDPTVQSSAVRSPLVRPPRHPAEELTGCRLAIGDAEPVGVHMPLPQDAAASLSHLAVAIDVAAGQAAARQLPGPETALRTLSLNLQLGAPPAAGTWVSAHGRLRSQKGRSLLTSCEILDASGDLVALGTGRFIIVDVPRRGLPTPAPVPLDRSALPPAWDDALGLGDPQQQTEDPAQTPITVRSAAPSAATDNGAGMVHGGVQVRALELAMRSALEAGSPPRALSLSDVAVVFHRPVPLDSGAGVQTRSSVRRTGRRVSVAEASLMDADQRLLTTAEGIFTAASSSQES